MRVDIRHLATKGQLRKLSDRVCDYVETMKQQGKPVDRVIVSPAQYDQLQRMARGRVIACGDALVYFNHDPIDERTPVYESRPRPVYDLPAVTANPFGISAPEKTFACARCQDEGCVWCQVDSGDSFADNDVPF